MRSAEQKTYAWPCPGRILPCICRCMGHTCHAAQTCHSYGAICTARYRLCTAPAPSPPPPRAPRECAPAAVQPRRPAVDWLHVVQGLGLRGATHGVGPTDADNVCVTGGGQPDDPGAQLASRTEGFHGRGRMMSRTAYWGSIGPHTRMENLPERSPSQHDPSLRFFARIPGRPGSHPAGPAASRVTVLSPPPPTTKHMQPPMRTLHPPHRRIPSWTLATHIRTHIHTPGPTSRQRLSHRLNFQVLQGSGVQGSRVQGFMGGHGVHGGTQGPDRQLPGLGDMRACAFVAGEGGKDRVGGWVGRERTGDVTPHQGRGRRASRARARAQQARRPERAVMCHDLSGRRLGLRTRTPPSGATPGLPRPRTCSPLSGW